MSNYALICRNAAFGLLGTAREHRFIGQHREASRLVAAARFYWRLYKAAW